MRNQENTTTRRDFVKFAGIAGLACVLSGCSRYLNQIEAPIAPDPTTPYLETPEPTAAWMEAERVLSSHTISLEDRYPQDEGINYVMKYNILLAMAYMGGAITSASEIDESKLINSPSHFEFTLEPGQVFAFHDDVIDELAGYVTRTTNTHFTLEDGFRSDRNRFGSGVCDLASHLNWVANDAGLRVVAPSIHHSRDIPEIPKEYQVSILYMERAHDTSSKNNLYIANTFNETVTFSFNHRGGKLTILAIKKPS